MRLSPATTACIEHGGLSQISRSAGSPLILLIPAPPINVRLHASCGGFGHSSRQRIALPEPPRFRDAGRFPSIRIAFPVGRLCAGADRPTSGEQVDHCFRLAAGPQLYSNSMVNNRLRASSFMLRSRGNYSQK